MTEPTIIPSDHFDPPLDGAHMEQVQKVINMAIEEDRARRGEYPREEGDTLVLGPGIFSSKDRSVLNWEGVNYVPQAAKIEQPPLKSYRQGESVEVFADGDWKSGFVQAVDNRLNILTVHTDRGPKTVASSKAVRKLA